jgi:hypothetical protein
MEVNIKKELENLDKSDYDKVCELVNKIISDLMIDLINPDHLDFDKLFKIKEDK